MRNDAVNCQRWQGIMLAIVVVAAMAVSSLVHADQGDGHASDFIECDVWGVNVMAPPTLNEEGVLTAPYFTGPYPEVIEQVWTKHLGVSADQPGGANHSFCLKAGNAIFSLSAVFRSETEGSFVYFREYDSLDKCKEDNYTEQVRSFPRTPLSRSCPYLKLGASKDEVERQLGKVSVSYGEKLYLLQDDKSEYRGYCESWLKVDESGCCYPGMELSFSDGYLKGIVIADGHGEGPPCDENPESLR